MMNTLAKTLIAGTALLILTPMSVSAAESGEEYGNESGYYYGGDYGDAEVINGQLNLGTVWSNLDVSLGAVDGTAAATSQAVGNTVNIFTMSNTYVDNDQTQVGDVGSEVNVDAWEINGDLLITGTALCNGAAISTDPDVTAVTSSQLCNANDPSATINANVVDVAGGVGIAAMSVSNQIQVDTNARDFPIDSYQESAAASYATVNANISNVGAVDASAVAVGNTATFIHY